MDMLRWKGLLAEEDRKVRLKTLLALVFLCGCMTFVQYGFVGLGANGDYVAYGIALLAPITIAALLLGTVGGTVVGLLAGAILVGHSKLLPLDINEAYLVTPMSSLLLYGGAGLLLALLLGLALRKNPQGPKRIILFAIICVLTAMVSTAIFNYGMLNEIGELPTRDLITAISGLGDDRIQIAFDAVLMFVSCLATDAVVRWYLQTKRYVSVRTIFHVRMIAMLCLVFLTISTASFVAITLMEQRDAAKSMRDELEYVGNQMQKRWDTLNTLLDNRDVEALPDEVFNLITDGVSITDIIDGYDLTDGTLLLVADDVVYASYNPAFPVQSSLSETMGEEYQGVPEYLSKTGKMEQIVYYDGKHNELGYMLASEPIADSEVYLLISRPFSMVFAQRAMTLMWTSLVALVLVVAVYVFMSRLLSEHLVNPIDRINVSLGNITRGRLDELVSEVNSIEFATLSLGINTTVDSLKEYAAESARRIEKDLATARAIQIGALPKSFPAFPDIHGVDLYAAMDAAKEVGGDFYDFFEIDDHTVGFLIADVSGKGIPGALFMMAAKAEIQNYLSVGIAPAEAIAKANAYLCAHNEAGMFVTVWAATLDWQTGELTYVNAGHNFPLLRHGHAGEWEWLKKKCGLFLGTFETAKYRQETLLLEPGDELLLYTDGVNEAFNVEEKEYGNDRLEAFLVAHDDLRPEELVYALRADVATWAEGAEQSDDVTILAVEYLAES